MSRSEFQHRQQAVASLIKDNSALLVVANQEQTRSRDTEYSYRQHSDFWYLTGFNEPDAWWLLTKRDGQVKSVLFCRAKDPLAEIWQGRRLGPEQAVAQLGFDQAYDVNDKQAKLSELMNGLNSLYFALGEAEHADQEVQQLLAGMRAAARQGVQAPTELIDWRPLVHEMRLFKSSEEIALMREAGRISALGHLRAMEQCQAGQLEFQLEADILHEFARHGARFAAYATIVGGGDNACILHYTENSSPLQNGDLVLIDAGAEYQGYAGDITRTFPVSGRFSEPQRLLYQLVLDAQTAALAILGPGQTIKAANQAAVTVMVSGLVELGILAGDVEKLIEEGAYKAFYMHGLSHWLGLDVHDVGSYQSIERDRELQPDMVLTVEPGLYISQDAEVDEKWRGIGIRIEDDVLITSDGIDNLTELAPKTVAEIEALMAQARG
ncbi:Xaa-Pro aminopeptidase [Motilimonas pumila]|uniref:Xaa-Pro aminopeptidase n=1 Tax=Motilimonas pumila TaxID=2303987 RepID=A0A418YC63_9GAMM|nr:Xaa-Pro aminopeptidase [Motilimonas pumila]